MSRIILMLSVAVCLMCPGHAAWGQTKAMKTGMPAEITNQRQLLNFVGRRLAIVRNSSIILLHGRQSVMTSGKNSLGIVVAHEMMAHGTTVIGLAITERLHTYSDNSMALIAVGGRDKASGLHGIGEVRGKSKVGLAIGDTGFVSNDARIGIVIGDVAHIKDNARLGLVVGNIASISNKAQVGIVIGDISHGGDKSNIFLHIDKNLFKPPKALWKDDNAEYDFYDNPLLFDF